MKSFTQIPIIDLFAGPGGLGEGFSSVTDLAGNKVFDIRVSIEKDPVAHRTLALRALYRKLVSGTQRNRYYDYIRGYITRDEFLSTPSIRGEKEHSYLEARCATLGETPSAEIDAWIKSAINGQDPWVLIGGPPCQAYSLAGRARMRGADPDAFESDKRHLLYKEYLRIIREFQPTVFVMENVKGILSSKHAGKPIFDQILEDLSQPSDGLEYEIRSFVTPTSENQHDPHEYVIRSENYCIPQMRHRVILLGIRRDYAGRSHKTLKPRDAFVPVHRALSGLPTIRSRLSKEPDSHKSWLDALRSTTGVLLDWDIPEKREVKARIADAVKKAAYVTHTGATFEFFNVEMSPNLPLELSRWIHDPLLKGVIQHESRSHMRADIQRYMFAACYSTVMGSAPVLSKFPPMLLPKHKNVDEDFTPFVDRFKVQLGEFPSKTIVSHIAKDGHYYIHHDAAQCRSYSVREACRLQTFPDNYFFEGNKTEQYAQVGNAVPPFLAKQLGEIVAEFLQQPAIRKEVIYQADMFPFELIFPISGKVVI